MSKFAKCARGVSLALFLIIITTGLFAQSTTEGAIGGTVADPTGAVIPGATVTIHNNGTNFEQTATTDGTGYFSVRNLSPATYTVTVNAKGFAAYKATQVIVTVGSLTSVSPHMTMGNTEQVDVSAETPVINLVSSEFAPTINEEAISNLPINGGRWSSFTLLTPGVVSDGNGFGLVSFRGMSTLLNNVTVDGADNNQAYFSEERGRTRAGYSTAKTAVQEFQVNTSNYSAEYGRAAGGVVNTVTKSGANQLHGEGFWYDRDNEWGAKNRYTTLTKAVYGNGASAPPTSSLTSVYAPIDVRKMGGFGVGGAILKDRLFWFVAYDRYSRNFPGTAVPSNASTFFAVPDAGTPLNATGAATTCAGAGANAPATKDLSVCQLSALLNSTSHTISTANVNAVTNAQYATAQGKWLNAMFGSGSQLGLIGITGPTPRKGDQDILFPKLDWIINQKNHASFEVNRMRWWSPAGIQTQATNNYGINSFGNDYVKTTWGVAKLDTQITNTIGNQLRFQYGRDFEFEYNQKATPYETQTLVSPVNPSTGVATGYTNPYGLPPNVYIGSFQWGTPVFLNRPKYPDEYKTQVADTVSKAIGRHSLKFGVDFVKTDENINNLYQQYAEFSYSGLPQYFASVYDPTRAYFTDYYQAFQGGSTSNPVKTYKFSTDDIAFFAQDDFKLSRRLSPICSRRSLWVRRPSPPEPCPSVRMAGVRAPDSPGISLAIPRRCCVADTASTSAASSTLPSSAP